MSSPRPDEPELPPDLKEACCNWLFRGESEGTAPAVIARRHVGGIKGWQSWELLFGATLGSELLGYINVNYNHTPVRFFANACFSFDPKATMASKALGKFTTRDAAARAIYKHARKEIARAIRSRLSA